MTQETSTGFENLEVLCKDFIKRELTKVSDSAHNLDHIVRVVRNAKEILAGESADAQIVIAAAWLHDCVMLPKDHPDRKKASAFAAEKAAKFLMSIDFPAEKVSGVQHAVNAHSFSAGIVPQTIEAKIVQDADRMDAIGAIGIARCLMVGGKLDRALYHPTDPFIEERDPDDRSWTIDHFYVKLIKLPDMMHTAVAKKQALGRVRFMKKYLNELENEIS